MFKNLLSGVAALALIGLLAVLIVQSRGAGEDYYRSHTARLDLLRRTQADVASIVMAMHDTTGDARPLPSSIESDLARLNDSISMLHNIGRSEALEQQGIAYFSALRSFIEQSQTIAEHRARLFEALNELQTESPIVVKDLRRFKLEKHAQNAFTVTLDLLDHVTGKVTSGTAILPARVSALGKDASITSIAPGLMDHFVSLARSVLSEYDEGQRSLQELDITALQSVSQQLIRMLVDANHATVGDAERAQMLLAILSVLLLVAAGIIGLRLHQSYRALNKSNLSLEQINSSLEERVFERTQELSTAYDELKESQVQLIQAEKMSSLGALVAGISHEINTPLWYLISNATTIRGHLHDARALTTTVMSMLAGIRGGHVKQAVNDGLRALDIQIKAGLDEDLDEAYDLIEDCVQGLNDLTEMAQSLKDFSRLDRAPVGQFDVNEGLDKTLRIVKNKIKNRITVVKHYGDLAPITCSPSQINQIFLNLISNAADAIDDHGEITLTTTQDNDHIQIQIADTGCGVPDKILSKILDPFFTTKEVGQGTGLGLSIVEKIVKSHNGELHIDSTVGEGSVFRVRLPIDAMTTAARNADATDDEAIAAPSSITAGAEINTTGTPAVA